jgi:hypothetical protein
MSAYSNIRFKFPAKKAYTLAVFAEFLTKESRELQPWDKLGTWGGICCRVRNHADRIQTCKLPGARDVNTRELGDHQRFMLTAVIDLNVGQQVDKGETSLLESPPLQTLPIISAALGQKLAFDFKVSAQTVRSF